MSFIGNPLVSMNYPVDYFTGDGSTNIFTLSNIPASTSSIIVSVNGTKLVSSSSNPGYFLDGSTLTISNTPTLNATIEVVYLGVLSQVNVPADLSITGNQLSSNLSLSGTTTVDNLTVTGDLTANIPNSSLSNSSITINGTSISLGSSGSITAGATITDDTSTNATRYLMLGSDTSGAYTSANVSSTKLTYNPSTGILSSVGLTTTGNVSIGTSNSSVSLTSNGSIRVINPELQTVETAPNTYADYSTALLLRNETPITDNTGSQYYGTYSNQKVYANSASTYTTVYGSFNSPRVIGIATTSRLAAYGTVNRLDRGGNEPLDVANNPNTSLFGSQNIVRHIYNANANTAISTSTVYGTLNQIVPQIGTIVNGYGTYNNIIIGATTNASANATNYYANYSAVTVGSSNTALSTSTLSNYYGLYLATPTVNATGAITNRWGIYQADNLAKNILSGSLGVGTTSPNGILHVQSPSITAAAPSLGWPVYNAETDTNSKSVYIDTAGNGSIATSGYGATVSLVLGQYYDSRVVITPPGSGGASPSDQGTGYGKDLLLKAGTSDNGIGYNGGRLYLSGGSGYSSVPGFNSNYGNVVIQPFGGNVGIGTNSPSGKLETIITATASATSISRVSNYTDAAYFTRNTNVGKQALVFRGSDSISSVIETGREAETVNWNTYFAFYTQGGANVDGIVERVRINGSGTLILNQGQIKFPATQVASADANTLDDYEEGTWTPVLKRTDSTVNANYTVTNATYVKIGRLITVKAYFYNINCSVANGSGYWGVFGFPFQPNQYSATFLGYNNMSVNSGYVGDGAGMYLTVGPSIVTAAPTGTTFMLNLTYETST